MKIQIDFPKEVHKFIRLEKVKRDKITLAETVVSIIKDNMEKK